MKTIKQNPTRVKLALAVVSAYGTMTERLADWYVEAGKDGITALPFLRVWKTFRRDAGLTSSSEQYGSLYVTLQRLVQGAPRKAQRNAATKAEAVDEHTRAIHALALAGHLLDRKTLAVLVDVVG